MKIRIPAELVVYEPVTHMYVYDYCINSVRCSSCGANSNKQICSYCGNDLLKDVFNSF